MIDKLRLPFVMLSDPDRSRVIGPWGVADPKDPRDIARPAHVLVSPDGDEVFRRVARDWADRPTVDEVLGQVRRLGLDPAEPESFGSVDPEPGPKAMPVRAMPPYYRGARFAVLAMKSRFPETADEVDRYVGLLDGFRDAVAAIRDA